MFGFLALVHCSLDTSSLVNPTLLARDASTSAPGPSVPLVLDKVVASKDVAGTEGVLLTLEGTGIPDGAVLTLDGKVHRVVVRDSVVTAGPVDLPTKADQYPVTVTNAAGASASQPLTVYNPTPIVTSLEASSTALGEGKVTLTLQGASYVPGLGATVGGVACVDPCTVNVEGDSVRIGPVTNPSRGQVVEVVVTNPAPHKGGAKATYQVPWLALSITEATLSSDRAGSTGVTLRLRGNNMTPEARLSLPSAFVPSGVVQGTVSPDGKELVVTGLALPSTSGKYEMVLTNPPPTLGLGASATVWLLSDGTSCDVQTSLEGVTTCGVDRKETCCASPAVEGGTFKQQYDRRDFIDATHDADVSSFRLDKYEVTVGRFRRFVDAWTAGWRPIVGAGKHAHVHGGKGLVDTASGYESGWSTDWGATLPGDKAGWANLLACAKDSNAWTLTSGDNEQRPINCVSWFAAYAFCTWDGGFLPSQAEWNYAASGGIEQRYYPWLKPIEQDPTPNRVEVSPSHASYYVDDTKQCFGDSVAGCTFSDILPVGSRAAGVARWGQLDMGGNLWEWNLDWMAELTVACTDCANTYVNGTYRVIRGGGYHFWASGMRSAATNGAMATARDINVGFRCSRGPSPR